MKEIEEAFRIEMLKHAAGTLECWMEGWTDGPPVNDFQRRLRLFDSGKEDEVLFEAEPGIWPNLYTKFRVKLEVILDAEPVQPAPAAEEVDVVALPKAKTLRKANRSGTQEGSR